MGSGNSERVRTNRGGSPAESALGANEPEGAGGSGASGVFLSPRVVDREAFNDYSASLRRLIEQAGEQAAALRAAAAQAQGAQDALRELAGKNHPRLEAALKALGALEQRSLEAQRLMAGAQDAAGSLEAVRRDLAGEVDRCEQQARERAGQVIDGLSPRLAELEQQAERIIRVHEDRLKQQVDGALALIEARLQSAEDKFARRMGEMDAWSKDLLRRTELHVAAERDRASTAVQALMRQTADAHAEAQSMAADLSVLARRGEALQSEQGEGSLRVLVSEAQRLAGELRAWVENPPPPPPVHALPTPPDPITLATPATPPTPAELKLDEAALRPLLDTLREELAEDLAPLVAALREVVAKAGA